MLELNSKTIFFIFIFEILININPLFSILANLNLRLRLNVIMKVRMVVITKAFTETIACCSILAFFLSFQVILVVVIHLVYLI